MRPLSVDARERHDWLVHLSSVRFRRELRRRRLRAGRLGAMGWCHR